MMQGVVSAKSLAAQFGDFLIWDKFGRAMLFVLISTITNSQISMLGFGGVSQKAGFVETKINCSTFSRPRKTGPATAEARFRIWKDL